MKRILTTLFTLIFALGIHTAKAQNISVSGYVYEKLSDGDTTLAVGNINVINIRDFSGTVTNKTGYFKINIKRGDTLIFSSISHEADTFICRKTDERNKYFISVVLRPEYYELNPIEVYGKDFEGFKHDFVHLEVKDTVFIRLAPQWQFEPMKEGFGITINGPLTALYNAFSKQGRELKKLELLLAADREQAYLDSVYKRPVVLHFLELSESQIDELVSFCNFSKHYVNRSTDYELLISLESCYQEFKRVNGIRSRED
ncbi:MAG: hypothetical protein ACPGLV_03425 [Bacteroidia bacterium]